MSDNIVEITETSEYTVIVDTSLVVNDNNISIQLESPNTIEISDSDIVLVSDIPPGYPISYTTGDLPVSRVSGLIGESGIYYNDGNIGISGIPYDLIPVHDIVGGSGLSVTSNSGIFTVAVTGTFGLTSEQVDDRVSSLLVAGSNIVLNYDDNNNSLTISTSGLQPSGDYSVVGHSHSSTDINDFNIAVSGLIPPSNFSSLSGVSGIVVTNSGTDYVVALSDPTIQLADITDLSSDGRTFLLSPSSSNLQNLITNETGSGLLVFNDSPAFSGIPTVPTAPSGTNNTQIANTSFVRNEISNLVNSAPTTLDTLNELAAALGNDANFATTIASGLSQKANLVHSHFSSDITDFNSSVSGLLPVKNVIGSGYVNVSDSSGVYTIGISGLQPSGNYSIVGHTHDYSDITNWASGIEAEVSTLLVAGNYINIDYDNLADTLTISTTGLQPSGNYSLVGHTHTSLYITDFNSSVSGLLPVKDILAGSGISIGASSGVYTVTAYGVAAASASALVTECDNMTGATISKMSVVYINGGHGNRPTIQKAIADSETGSSKTYGLTASAINDNQTGNVISFGLLIDVNTDQFGVSEGSTLYLSPTVSGAITTTKPTAPYHMVTVGKIVRNHANQGIIAVNIQNGFELGELHNVATNGTTNGQFLQYSSASGLWVPTSSGNFTSLSVNGTGVSISGHTHTVSNITDFNVYLEKSIVPHSTAANISASGSSPIEYVYIFSDLATNYALILPNAVNNKSEFTLKNNTIGTVYLQTSAGQTIDGYSDIGLNRRYMSISVISDGSNWIIV